MNVLPELLILMKEDYQSKTTIPILIVIGNLLAGDNDITHYCLDLKVICHLKATLNQTQNNNHIINILWCFSNIAEGTEEQISVNLICD